MRPNAKLRSSCFLTPTCKRAVIPPWDNLAGPYSDESIQRWKYMSSQATPQDAELILKLYDLRREPVMREARSFMATFSPKSYDDVAALANSFGTKEQTYLRQVSGYWEMAASLVNRGAINRELALDNYQEMFFIYAKMEPYVEEFRQKMGQPNAFRQVQQLVESSEENKQRLKAMQAMQAEMAKRRAQATAGVAS